MCEEYMRREKIELRGLRGDLMFEEAQSPRDNKKITEIKRRIKELEKAIDDFYADPMTQALGL